MSTSTNSESGRSQIGQLLEEYMASIVEYPDDVLMALHRKNAQLNADELFELTARELDRRGMCTSIERERRV